MSRSAADATRFTATGPYASSKPSASSPYKLPGFLANSSPNPQNNASGPSGGRKETPKEKVERLRAQARATRIKQSTSRADQLIDFGRRFANKAHKGMVYTLITASGICGALTVYSMISLTLYNRRQRALWIEKEMQTLKDAQAAYVIGTATSEQLELLKKEKIEEIFQQKKAEEKAQRPWNKVKTFLLGGLKTDETPSPNVTTANTESTNKPAVLEVLNTAENKLSPADVSASSPPGQLDVLAQNAETAAKETTRSWKSWLTGR
ncbi:cytochrome oxidase c assembly-domain-containing protein [Aspergillus pseudoustus]|uniref:Cytochrome oxidase c assembly-domain-containing protein n=1 Tax=Aspergillus pseudoustus TaxID=1810923 RepID=A0ABR4JUE4_9EURO